MASNDYWDIPKGVPIRKKTNDTSAGGYQFSNRAPFQLCGQKTVFQVLNLKQRLL
ncbi:Hypothetical predicted protein [Podarcis lilfordi]|uniref:Uncharacterized protein n=1 Tax=Podarcis lilfordi TaxID=74358 RepID=A0AA35K6B8_9SAUR|nr:Hypothetical predicted protein [Podarcis lilfordi]